MGFLEKLDARMAELGLNRRKLSQISGVPYTTIDGLYKKGYDNAKISTLRRLAAALSVSIDYLVDDARESAPAAGPTEEERALTKGWRGLDGHGRRLVRLVLEEELKRLGESAPAKPEGEIVWLKHYLVPAAAGYASPVEGEDYELIPLPENAPRGADFCLTVRGDSMEPYIRDGELAYVQRDAPLKEFEPGIFYVDGDVLVKQWCIDYAGTLHLLSANPLREDANRSIPKSSGATVVCFGKVLLDRKLPRPYYGRE